jgi:toxin CcdB
MARVLMARFDIYLNPGKNGAEIPFLLDVQSNIISALASRIVVPLRLRESFAVLDWPSDLFPTIVVRGISCFLDTPQLGAIPFAVLKAKIGSAKAHQLQIQAALDRTFGAY